MRQHSLKSRIGVMLDNLSSITSSLCDVDIFEYIEYAKLQLYEPLRLAIVGETSAGKSTLLNALIRQQLVPTGALTLTYNVNVLRHISYSPTGKEMIMIHKKDGTCMEATTEALSNLVDGRVKDEYGIRDDISWIEAFIPFEYIIRKTKRSEFLERSDIFSKTKCTSGVYPRLQNKFRPASPVFTA